ncbi:MAG: hypothetical protein AAGF84_10670 [Planctomycetota bacterium]
MRNAAPIRWLDLLAAVEPEFDRDPAAMGRAIRRWATLAAATHRAESVKTRGVETVSSFTATEVAE